jgi:hypothetical protein
MVHKEEKISGTHIFTELNELNEYSVTRLFSLNSFNDKKWNSRLGSFYTEFESSQVELRATRLTHEFWVLVTRLPPPPAQRPPKRRLGASAPEIPPNHAPKFAFHVARRES